MAAFSPLFGTFPLNTTETYPSRASRSTVANVTVGAAAGATATKTTTKVPHGVDNGGVRTPVTTNEINRATTAQDVTNLKEVVITKKVANTFAFPKDLSGNGGPAFTRSY